jgi:hypothetical protein
MLRITPLPFNPQRRSYRFPLDLRLGGWSGRHGVKTNLALPIYLTLRGGGTWLRHYAKSWKVAGSIPDEVIEFFQLT